MVNKSAYESGGSHEPASRSLPILPAATMSAVLSLGTRVQVTAGVGYVRFVGQTAFAAGKWVGVELDEPTGKNDGSVAGQRYFACAEGHGVFVRASMVTVLDEAGDTEAAPVRLLSLFRALTLRLIVSSAVAESLQRRA